MKLRNILKEFQIPMDVDGPFDDMVSRDTEDRMPSPNDTVHKDREKIPERPRRRNKGRDIRNIVSMMKRERSNVKNDQKEYIPDEGDNTEPAAAAHGSNFLFR